MSLVEMPAPVFASRLLVAWCGLAIGVAASGETVQLATVPESGITVEVEGWAGISTPQAVLGRDVGLLPLVVTITNKSPFDRTWKVEPDPAFGGWPTSAVPVTTVSAPAGGSGRATLYVDPGNPGYGTFWIKVSGFGLNDGAQRLFVRTWDHGGGTSSGTNPVFPAAISRGAVVKAGKGLEKFTVPGGAGLDLARAPEDWRGWSVFSCILCTESEWRAMSAGQRKAFVDWVGLGGRAGLLVTDPSAERLDAIDLPAAGPDGRRRVGAGEIVPVKWDGNEIDPRAVGRFLAGRSEHPQADRITGYVAQASGANIWSEGFRKLFDVFGPRLLPASAILAFLAIFGLVAGPLNVMLLAGPGRRARMFWTTPLISLIATAFLLGLMFLRDGVGGAGVRRTLGLLMPEQNGMAIIQEQFSRTGVLLGNSFPIREPSWMRPLGNVEAAEGFLEVDGRQREGNWFRSRSDQAYLIETVRPSRAKIEVIAGDAGAPAVVSSIEVPLDRVFVIDEDGKYWTATDVGTGERKPLERSDAAAYATWFDTIAADAGPIRRAALDAVRNLRGHAYAEAGRAAKSAVQTLGSIRWVDDRAAFMGPSTRTAAK